MKIELGLTKEKFGASRPAEMDVAELLATRLLVQGNSGSGKSHLLRRLLEQSAPHVQQVIIDPEGDFVSLSDKFGHVVIDANMSTAELEVIAVRVRKMRVSAVLNLESLESDMQMRAAGIFLNAMFDVDREFWYPVLVVVDEAQLFAPSAAGEASDESRKVSLGAMTNLMCRGRKRGLCGVIATQRLAKLAKNVAAEASNFLMGRTFLDIDMARAVDLLGMDKKDAERFRELERGSFVALGPALSRTPLSIQVGSVETQARGSTPGLSPRPEMDAAAAAEAVLAPIGNDKAMARRPAPMQADPQATEALLAVVEAKASENEMVEAGGDVEDAGEARPAVNAKMVYHEVAAEIMGDLDSFMSSEASLYQEFQTLIRIRRLGIPVPPIGEFRKYASVARGGVPVERMGDEDWRTVLDVSKQIDDDRRSVYLLLAGAAIQGFECPSDATIARVCGTASTGRALRRMTSLETDGFIVSKNDMKGNRIVAIPDLRKETLPGDPRRPDDFGVAAAKVA